MSLSATLTALKTPAWQQALENILSDLPSQNPKGNICQKIEAFLSQLCTNSPISIDNLTNFALQYQTPQNSDHYSPAPWSGLIQRIVPLSHFVVYHLARHYLIQQKGIGGINDVDKRTIYADELKTPPSSDWLEALKNSLKGMTGHPQMPTWWTFLLPLAPPFPNEGRKYLEELALPDEHQLQAKIDNYIVEITLEASDCPGQLFKPNALDGWGANTPFCPYFDSPEHGMTAPAPGYEARPELISSSFHYQEAGRSLRVMLKLLPY